MRTKRKPSQNQTTGGDNGEVPWLNVRPVSDTPSQPRISVVIRNVVWVGIVAHSGFVPMFWLLGQPQLAAFNLLSVASWVVAAILNRRGQSSAAMWLLTAEIRCPATQLL